MGRDTDAALESACYMLLDMDSVWTTMLRDAGAVGEAARGVVEEALAGQAPIGWYSVGHALAVGPDARLVVLIDAFVGRHGSALAPRFAEYARSARVGAVL
jgi:hypothetical protein